MTTNFLIGYPDIPFASESLSLFENAGTEATGHTIRETVNGERGDYFELTTAQVDSLMFRYVLPGADLRGANYLYIARANRLRASGVTTAKLHHLSSSANRPNDIGGLQLWLDAQRGVTYASDNTVSAWLDRSSNAINFVQSTAANKPLRTRADNRENWFTYSEEFTNAAWTKNESTATAAGTVNPLDGDATASKLTESALNTDHYIRQSVTDFVVNRSYTTSVYVRKGTRTQCRLVQGAVLGGDAYFDLDAGTIISNPSGTASISAVLSNGFYRLSLTATAASSGACNIDLHLANGGASFYAGDGVSYIYIYAAQVHRNSSSSISTTYVKSTSGKQIAGVNGEHSVWFQQTGTNYLDGSNPAALKISGDCSIYAVIKPHGTAAGYKKIINSETGSATGYMVAIDGGSSNKQTYRTCSGVQTTLTGTGGSSTDTRAIIGFIKSGGTTSARLNSAANGSGAITNPVDQTFYYIGSSAQGFEGHICEIVVYNKALSAGEYGGLEEYLSKKWYTTPPIRSLSLADETLYGARSEDFIETFDAEGAVRVWYVTLGADTSTKFPTSKVNFGTLFDFGREPTWSVVDKKEAKTTNYREQAHIIKLQWKGISDTIQNSFIDKVVKYADINPVVLYETTDVILRGWKVVMCKLVDFQTEARTPNSNTISCVFEELI